MSDIGGGNGGFDEAFFRISATGAIVVLLFLPMLLVWRHFRARDLPRWPSVALIVAATVLGPGISLYWQIGDPSANGIEGAGRFVVGGAATLGSSMLAGLGALPMLEQRSRWVAFMPAGSVLVFWLIFLFS